MIRSGWLFWVRGMAKRKARLAGVKGSEGKEWDGKGGSWAE